MGSENRYPGLDEFAVKLIKRKARQLAGRAGFLQADRQDLEQEMAMDLLQAGVDRSVIALWLGHESTQTTHIYEHADPALKERAIARTAPLGVKPGRYRASDTLLAFLEAL